MNWQERVARDQKRRAEANAKRRNKALWDAKLKARVTHPRYGSVEVPCHSPLAAIECAAELWGVEYGEIAKETEVKAI